MQKWMFRRPEPEIRHFQTQFTSVFICLFRSTVESAEKPAGEWNTMEVVCKGNFIQAYVNGVLMNEAHLDRAEGRIALQSEGGPLEVRNVFITPVK